MKLLFLDQWLSDDVLRAVGWTLLHSLWQGLLAAAVAGIIIIGTKRSTASVRYNLLSSIFVLFIACTCVTFYFQLQQGGTIAETKETITLTADQAVEYSLALQNGKDPYITETNFYDRFINYFNEHAPLAVLAWAFIFLLKCVRMLAGFHYIHRIRKYKIHSPTEEWKERIVKLSASLGIRRPVLLLQSELVKVPVVIGLLKPVILVPLGILSNLPPDQVQTILLHELAHIRRKDYLVNLLQSFIETIFFFNPGITWISSLIREEREACCDDIVVRNTTNKRSYLEALVNFQQYALNAQTHALGLIGKKNYLFNRVKRIVTRENKKLNAMEKSVLVAGLAVISAFSFTQSNDGITPVVPDVSNQSKMSSVPPVSDVKSIAAIGKKENKSAPPKTRKAADMPVPKVTDTIPEKVKIKEKDKTGSSDFKSISSNVNNDGNTRKSEITAVDKDGKVYHYKKVNDVVTEFSVNGAAVPVNDLGDYVNVIRQIETRQQASLTKKKEQENKRKQKENTHKAKENERKVKEYTLKRNDSLKKFTYSQRKQERAERDKMNKKRITETKKRMQSHDQVASIIRDLASNNLLDDSENLSFTLNRKELIVNGKKQDSEVHNRFKEKYIKGAMIPYKFGSSDGLFNLGSALAFVQTLPHGVYVAMNGRYFHATNVRKNKVTGLFEATS